MTRKIEDMGRRFAAGFGYMVLGLIIGKLWEMGGILALVLVPIVVCPLHVWDRGSLMTCTLDVPRIWPMPRDKAGRRKWHRYWLLMGYVLLCACMTRAAFYLPSFY
ncbi:hypothetical protein [Komagataeibacter europaeus]|uniref:hypothetical protein n=1 Tax=Komagataeibacter europaeus TaxID=33995 RepID=UPI0002EB0C6C|nr:hypothetical protein [Komagataeibacter europaeus]GBQ46744.1 hypothetical protein AA18890_2657 [Komagataeibacter europaeus LMG 18890]